MEKTKQNLKIIALTLAALGALSGAVEGQDGGLSPTDETAEEIRTDQAEARDEPRRRIVTREQIREHQNPLAEALMKPFRAIAPAVTDRVTRFEENREYRFLFGVGGNLPVSPVFGSSSPGAGFGVGFTASTKDYISKDFRLTASSIVSFSGYIDSAAGFGLTPSSLEKRDVALRVEAFQSVRPKEDYFGAGPNSFRSARSTFFHRETGLRANGSVKLGKDYRAGGFASVSRNDITDGSDARGAPIGSVYKPGSLPGFGGNIRLLEIGGFFQADRTDEPEYPRAGWFARVSLSASKGLGKSDHSWRTFEIDSRGYVPLGSKDRVIALRFLGSFRDPSNGSGIPFFRLSRLGDGDTLRGYETHRYRGASSVHLSVEYRYKLIQGIETGGLRGMDAVFFGDFGQVYDRLGDLKWGNIQTTWGGGVQFLSAKRVTFAILYAQSPEGGGMIFRTGKTF
ncbi:MAG: BamA/TamA family outer membrane protein [Acidobacteriota bacterium]|nr:MAG: BamA/TamA family outer membrane protein [Acidobacteriota bacterium]